MIPDNEESTTVVSGDFLYPDNIIPLTLQEDYEMGGIAIQDPSQGLEVQVWRCKWEESTRTVTLYPEKFGDPVDILTDVDIRELSFSFDQNMRWVLAVLHTDGKFFLHWYDTAQEKYVETRIDGVSTFKLANDTKSEDSIRYGLSDVILTYIQLNKLYVRNQRDRYLIQHLINPDIPANVFISNFGMSTRNRMQWRMKARIKREQV